jgi:hypothetical protein
MISHELRIGNWVMIDPSNIPQQVCDVMCDSVNTDKVQGAHYGLVDAILLTEEWLLKFGFEIRRIKDITNYTSHKLDLYQYLSNNNKIFFEYSDGDVEIKYVHQLQNLYFALTGEELKYEDRTGNS